MVTIASRVDGLPELRARLQRGQGDAEFDDVLREAAFELEARSKRRAPVDTGRLRSSIATFRLGRLQYGVVAQTYYAAFQEFGTGQAGARSPQPDGVPPEYQHGPGAGMDAQPYVRPSLIEVRELLKDPNTWRNVF